MRALRVGITALGAITALALGAGTATAAEVENGKFETDTLDGWDQDFFGTTAWFTYEGPFFGSLMRGPAPAPVPAPPQGQFGAITDQLNPGAMFLSQVVKLERGMKHKLRFKLAYRNLNTGEPRALRGDPMPGFHTPKSFRFGKAARPNQQFRMDVLKPNAPIKSLKNKNILERVYRTERGDPMRRGFRKITADLSEYAGDRVRLRFATVVTEAQLNAAIDVVAVKSKRRR
jgi:hypothetical protein